jgi:hypothetical protein
MPKRIHRTMAEKPSKSRAKTFSLAIYDMENDAFSDNPREELARILRAIAENVIARGDVRQGDAANTGRAVDSNGNTVGHWVIA